MVQYTLFASTAIPQVCSGSDTSVTGVAPHPDAFTTQPAGPLFAYQASTQYTFGPSTATLYGWFCPVASVMSVPAVHEVLAPPSGVAPPSAAVEAEEPYPASITSRAGQTGCTRVVWSMPALTATHCGAEAEQCRM